MSDEQDEAQDIVPEATQSGRATSPAGSGLRQRPLQRAATIAEVAPRFARRGSSFVSESLSESRRTLKESTDDIILPRANVDNEPNLESSHWHSLPLGLALFPAVGGLFFKDGSAFITDISLLALASLFLNWAVRLPWDWYLSAQAVVAESEQEMDIALEDDGSEAPSDITQSPERHPVRKVSDQALRAQNELRIHELLALLACFVFPAAGAWLLHTLRSQLTQRSESLISDYNLTIFLLASEVRPLSHLIKLVQRRTLFLQRTITVAVDQRTADKIDPKIADMAQRLEELETRIADSVMVSSKAEANAPSQADELVEKASRQANDDLRKTFQPEVDALNRAMRRYEKRATTAAIQVETRLQELESRVQDVVILAAATQRNADKHAGKYTPILMNWMSACIVVPMQYVIYVLTIPQRTLTKLTDWIRTRLGFAPRATKSQKGKNATRLDQPRRKNSKERTKT